MPPTTVREWRARREQGIEIRLPDYGDVVRIRTMDADLFFRAGRVPDFLAEQVRDIINGLRGHVEAPKLATAEDTQAWIDWLDELVIATFVSPKVVKKPQTEDELGVEEVSLRDKYYLYSLFGLSAEFLRGFFAEKVERVAAVPGEQSNGRHSLAEPERAAVGVAAAGAGR